MHEVTGDACAGYAYVEWPRDTHIMSKGRGPCGKAVSRAHVRVGRVTAHGRPRPRGRRGRADSGGLALTAAARRAAHAVARPLKQERVAAGAVAGAAAATSSSSRGGGVRAHKLPAARKHPAHRSGHRRPVAPRAAAHGVHDKPERHRAPQRAEHAHQRIRGVLREGGRQRPAGGCNGSGSGSGHCSRHHSRGRHPMATASCP